MIKKYFDHFACLPNIKVNRVVHNTYKINEFITINNAFVTWQWGDESNPTITTARMTFVVNTRRSQILELHSSVTPVPPSDLNEN